MFAIPGLILLILFDYFKPQQYVPLLAGLPLLYVFMGAAILGFAVDLRLRSSRLVPAPQLGLVILFFGWCILTTVPRGTTVMTGVFVGLLIPLSLHLLAAHAVQSLRMFRVIVLVMLAIGLSVAYVGVDQGLADWGCHREEYIGGFQKLVYDGRACSDHDPSICRQGTAEPGVRYRCEHVGLLGTQSIEGRVRFLGTMEDPNELALAVGIVMPLAFALFEQRRTLRRVLLLAATVALAALCAYFTESRGGQIVFLIVLGVYFVKRFGWRGAIFGLACAVPILLLGGRDTEEAAASTAERLECWSVGMRLFWNSPLVGAGAGQFMEHHYLTAHNSYVLTAAELGFPGMVLWTSILYLSIKIPLEALRIGRAPAAVSISPAVLSWSLALATALIGTAGGMLFLSYAYKDALWIFMGLSGALHQVIQRHVPSFQVRFGWRDLAYVATADLALALATTAYTHMKLGH